MMYSLYLIFTLLVCSGGVALAVAFYMDVIYPVTCNPLEGIKFPKNNFPVNLVFWGEMRCSQLVIAPPPLPPTSHFFLDFLFSLV